MRQTIDVTEFINSRPLSRYQWMVLVICTVVAAIDGLDVAVLAFIVPSMAQEWGVEKAAFGNVIGAGLFGVAVGALLVGPLSDRKGRKTVIMAAMALCAIGSLGCALSGSMTSLTVWRLVTGIGLGAALPNATTLLAEYSPERDRARLIAVMFLGFTLGSASAGFTAAQVLPIFGWKGMLILGALLPLACVILVSLALPESVRFMVVQKAPPERIGRTLSRIGDLSYGPDTSFTLPEVKTGVHHASISGLFAGGLGLGSVLLWLAYFMGLLVYYLLTSWLPSLIEQSGQPVEKAAVVSAMLMVGGAGGGLLLGWLMDKTKANYAVAASFVLGAGVVLYVGRGIESLVELQVCVFLSGLFVSGALSSMSTLAAAFYPTQSRATGVSWMLGIGRFGGILGAMGGGVMLGAGWDISRIFMALAIPALAAGLAVGLKGIRYGDSHDAALRDV